MSVEAIAAVLHHSRASGMAKLVLIGIANHDGDAGAWPSLATLAKYAGADERTVRRAIDELVASGELEKRRQRGGHPETTDPRHRPNWYKVLVECPPECDGSTQHRLGDNSQSRVDNDVHPKDQRVDISSDRGWTTMSDKPSLEPSSLNLISAKVQEVLEKAVEMKLQQADTAGTRIGNRLAYATTVRTDLAPAAAAKVPGWLERFDAPLDVMAGCLVSGEARQLAYYLRETSTPPEDEETLEEVHVLAHAIVMRQMGSHPTTRRAAVVHAKVAELIVDDGTRLALACLDNPGGSLEERIAAYETLVNA